MAEAFDIYSGDPRLFLSENGSRLYFIEGDAPEWGLLNDLYSYGAVQSIDIVQSRKEAADTAVITKVRFIYKEE